MRNIVTQRSRSRTDTSGLVSMTKVFAISGLPASGWPRNSVTFQNDTITLDTSTPKFKQLSGAGLFICKDYKNTVTRLTVPKGYYYQEEYYSGKWLPNVIYNTNVLSLLGSTPIVYPSWPTLMSVDVAHSQAVQALYARIDASDLQSFVAIAELNKTAGSLRQASSMLFKTALQAVGKQELIFAKYLRQIDIAKLSKNPKKAIRRLIAKRSAEIADVWLLARYGIRPLIYDVNACVKALKTGSKLQPHIRYNSVGTVQSDSASGPILTANAIEGKFQYRATRSKELAVRAGCVCTPTFDTETRIRLDRLSNLPETAWELIPYSFVVDWVFNVGQVIAALTPNVECPITTSWSIVEESNKAEYILLGCSHTKNATVARGALSGFTYSYDEKVRTRYAYPELSAVPSLRIRFDSYKAIDAVALCKRVVRLLVEAARKH